jgi:hypothetical protein
MNPKKSAKISCFAPLYLLAIIRDFPLGCGAAAMETNSRTPRISAYVIWGPCYPLFGSPKKYNFWVRRNKEAHLIESIYPIREEEKLNIIIVKTIFTGQTISFILINRFIITK